MNLDDYFDFSYPGEIRIQNHRIWMHDILKEYVERKMTVEELFERFDTLSREEIFAALLYYHRNKDAMDKHLAAHLEYCQRAREASRVDPFHVKMRARLQKANEARASRDDSMADR